VSAVEILGIALKDQWTT